MRVKNHPILGGDRRMSTVTITVDGREIKAIAGEPIAAALLAAGIKKFRMTEKTGEPRGVFCAIGRCTDCVMTVNGIPNIRTCVTPVENGMVIETQKGRGTWRESR
ncbi:Hydrogen cyanide synthase subunit HcnA [Koleobacter methoxysyntrophicus]|uniref:Hydrogen cyanide synthase subunit HcnA n=1 Tax=Koleobacter methoxysyntrophicus TaxID=2751313 RepID=A0A8A0RJ98_9FIRM|nr:(2Fe-2S)-binding protein [Koleobacter methoxysyntrophicus]QSQ08375.1 Hydrogen cyanide synthase subunit HcnA [Koleobacter methoxysyntrophicus]